MSCGIQVIQTSKTKFPVLNDSKYIPNSQLYVVVGFGKIANLLVNLMLFPYRSYHVN